MRTTFITLSLVALFATTPQAMSAEPPAEIEHLLHAIGQSSCVFMRNGKNHSATEAEDHLRMKYSRTKSRIRTAEAFIDRLASESSWTGKPYTMHCTNSQAESSKQWLYRELKQFRQD